MRGHPSAAPAKDQSEPMLKSHQAEPKPQIDRILVLAWNHTSLAVSDIDIAAAFFVSALGFSPAFVVRGMADQIARLTAADGLSCDLVQLVHPVSGHRLELIAFHPPGGSAAGDPLPLRPGTAHAAFIVPDLISARAVIEAYGAVVLGEIVGFDDGPALYARVPGGAFIELEEQT